MILVEARTRFTLRQYPFLRSSLFINRFRCGVFACSDWDDKPDNCFWGSVKVEAVW
jgi:hypothetical protein